MRTGKELLLATRTFAKEIPWLSWYYFLSSLVLLAAALVGTQIEALGMGWRVLFSIATGFMVLRVFVIYHDYQHGAILGQNKLADLLMNIFGMYSLAPASIWKRTHDHHHKHNSKLTTSGVGSFPMMTTEWYATAPLSQRLRYRIIRHPLTIAFSYITMFLWMFCIDPFRSDPRRHWDGGVALAMHIIIGAALFYTGGWAGLLLGQTLPMALAFATGAYLFYAQHNFPGVSFQGPEEWSYEDAALQSSSYLRMPRLLQWISANIGYHHVHHLNSRIPFYRLPEAMRSMPELQNPKTTSLAIWDVVRCLRLQLWDETKRRMVSWREVRRMQSEPVHA